MGMKKHSDLPDPGTRRDHEALVLGGKRDRLLLVLVERQRLPVRAEYVGAPRVQHAARNQGTDVRGALVAGIDLDQRLRPVTTLSVDGVDLLADVRRVDRRERCGEALVLADDAVPERKYIKSRNTGLGRAVRNSAPVIGSASW